MMTSESGLGRPIVFIVTHPFDANELSMPYALGFYVIFVAIPTVLTQKESQSFAKPPICVLDRPF